MNDAPRSSLKPILLTAFAAAVVGAAGAALIANIATRRTEAKSPFVRVVAVTDATEDPALWGKNFPTEYDLWRRTAEETPTKYGGSQPIPHAPTAADPRTVLSQSKIDLDPRLKVMWAGYAFAKDFREDRGHAFMLDDQAYTQRQQVVKQPGTCIQCHASVYVEMKKLGGGDSVKGFETLNQMPYAEARKRVSHPLSCIDCHDPDTMQLRVTRPAFLEGIRAWKASQGVANYDPNTMASRQEMRTFVCGQCHVEYYFKGAEKRLTFPWKNGLKADEILAYYDEAGFKDWTHAETGALALKAQHPEFEMWNQGIHARSGVACADCHMPYVRQGAMKVSDHWVRSPLLNVARACQPCHRWDEAELKARVEQIQDRTTEVRNRAMDALVALVHDLGAARAAGRSDAELKEALAAQRHAQFLLDFVEAENSTGFHAPGESLRVLSASIDASRSGQLALARR